MRRRALIVVCLLLSACTPASVQTTAPSSAPPIASPSDITPSPRIASPAVTSADPAPADQYGWVQVSPSVDNFTLQMDVAATPVGYVAVGVRLVIPDPSATFAPDSNPLASLYTGAVWTSPDGQSWSRLPDDPDFGGARMTKVVATDEGALIFGIGGVCLPDACGGLPPNGGTIVWASSDGQAWERLSDTGLADGAVGDVARTAGGYVAVGYVASTTGKQGQGWGEPTDAAVWRSTDGRSWTPVEDLPRGADSLTQVWSQGDRLVALGRTSEAVEVWASRDGGATWTAGPSLPDICCTSQAISGGTVVVVGPDDSTSETPFGVVSTSDGHGDWTRATPKAIRDIRPAWVQVVGTSVVVFGWTFHRDSDGLLVDDQERAFMSADFKSWTPLDLPATWESQAPIAVAARGRDVVAILGPLDTMNGPSDHVATSIWLGTVAN